MVGSSESDWRVLGRLKEAFSESDLPIRVDVLDWHGISAAFRRVIDQKFVVLQEGTLPGPKAAILS